MEDLYLSAWHLSKFSYLLCNLVSAQHIHMDEGQCFSDTPLYNFFIYPIKGDLRITCADDCFSVSPGKILFVSPCLNTAVSPAMGGADYLLLYFDFYAHHDYDLESVQRKLNDTQTNRASLLHTKMNINLGRVIDISDNNTIRFSFKRIQKEMDSKMPGSRIVIQSLLSDILVNLLRENTQQGMDSLLRHVDAVAFSSSAMDMPLQEGRSIWVTDVDVWSNDPDVTEAEAHWLGTMIEHQYYLDIPKQSAVMTYLPLEGTTYSSKNVGCFTAHTETPYHLWFWQRAGIRALDLRAYRETCCLTFYVKSNLTGPIGFAVFNTDSYTGLSYSVEIPVADTWIPVKIYLWRHIDEQSSPYVSKALAYIHTNYSHKILLTDIARHVHVHPSYLSAIFRKQTGNSIGNYLITYRLLIAKKLLIHSDKTVESIALDVGFYDLQHFSREFEKHIGVRPTVYRKINGKEESKNEPPQL